MLLQQSGIDVTAPAATAPWKIPAPRAGRLLRMQIKRPKAVDAAITNFTFNVYTSLEAAIAAMAGGSPNWYDAHALFGSNQSVASSTYDSGVVNLPYLNTDGTGPTGRNGHLYLVPGTDWTADDKMYISLLVDLNEPG